MTRVTFFTISFQSSYKTILECTGAIVGGIIACLPFLLNCFFNMFLYEEDAPWPRDALFLTESVFYFGKYLGIPIGLVLGFFPACLNGIINACTRSTKKRIITLNENNNDNNQKIQRRLGELIADKTSLKKISDQYLQARSSFKSSNSSAEILSKIRGTYHASPPSQADSFRNRSNYYVYSFDASPSQADSFRNRSNYYLYSFHPSSSEPAFFRNRRNSYYSFYSFIDDFHFSSPTTYENDIVSYFFDKKNYGKRLHGIISDYLSDYIEYIEPVDMALKEGPAELVGIVLDFIGEIPRAPRRPYAAKV